VENKKNNPESTRKTHIFPHLLRAQGPRRAARPGPVGGLSCASTTWTPNLIFLCAFVPLCHIPHPRRNLPKRAKPRHRSKCAKRTQDFLVPLRRRKSNPLSPPLPGSLAPWLPAGVRIPSPSQLCQIPKRTQQLRQIRPDRHPRGAPACPERVEGRKTKPEFPRRAHPSTTLSGRAHPPPIH
jgi:hypothetical protein